MERTTQKQLDWQIKFLNEALGLPTEPWTRTANGQLQANAGNIHVDNSGRCGYRLEQQLERGGTRVVGDDGRMNANNLWLALRMMIDAVEMVKKSA